MGVIWQNDLLSQEPAEVRSLRKQEIPFDYHVYAKGTHGLGLGTRETATKNMGHYEPQVSSWTECFKQWMGVMYE